MYRSLVICTAACCAVVLSSEVRAEGEPIRRLRKLSVGGEACWNGLAGLGPTLSLHLHPHVSIDGAAGVSAVGWKAGGRVRANLLKSNFTPFVGAGAMLASGTAGQAVSLDDPDTKDVLQVEVHPSAFMQLVVGIEIITDVGFVFNGTVGYAKLLGGNNVHVVSGDPSTGARTVFDLAYRSGPVLGVVFGYAFKA